MGVRKFWVGVVVIVLLASTGIGVALLYDQLDGTSRALEVHSSEINETTTESIVQYENMSEDQQSVFRSAVNSENGLAPIPETVDYGIWDENEYVKYQNKIYRVYMIVE
jgi:hypothetical protein